MNRMCPWRVARRVQYAAMPPMAAAEAERAMREILEDKVGSGQKGQGVQPLVSPLAA